MDPPPVRYIDRDGMSLAYQVVGEGPSDVVMCFEIGCHLDLGWTDPHMHYQFERAAKYSRMVYTLVRGFGLSDPIRYVPTVEQQADDILAVMDAVGIERATLAALVGTSGGAALVAARAPERVAGLVLWEPMACGPLGEGALTAGWTADEIAEFTDRFRAFFHDWGTGALAQWLDPALDTAGNRRLMALVERCMATPSAASAYMEAVLRLDISDVLGSVQAPARVLHTSQSRFPDAVAHKVVELIANGEYHEVPKVRPGAALGEAWAPFYAHIKEVATGQQYGADADSFFGAVLFTDIVSSTELLARLGDSAYHDVLAEHERQVRLHLETYDGRLVKTIGDGTLSVFDTGSKAVRCARAIVDSANELGMEVRAGVHCGDVNRIGPDLAGLTVHVAARVSAAAGAGEVLVSRAVRDLVDGSELSFTERGEHQLKGVPTPTELFSLGSSLPRQALPSEPSMQTRVDRATVRVARTAPGALRALTSLVARTQSGFKAPTENSQSDNMVPS